MRGGGWDCHKLGLRDDWNCFEMNDCCSEIVLKDGWSCFEFGSEASQDCSELELSGGSELLLDGSKKWC